MNEGYWDGRGLDRMVPTGDKLGGMWVGERFDGDEIGGKFSGRMVHMGWDVGWSGGVW